MAAGGGAHGGLGGDPSSHTVELWMSFVADPTARTWYRAHNASIVSAYLEHRGVADAESRPERIFGECRAAAGFSSPMPWSPHRVSRWAGSPCWAPFSEIRDWG